MSTRETAMDIVKSLPEEQLQAFVTLFGTESMKEKAKEQLMKELEAGKASGNLIEEQDVIDRLGVEL